MSDTLTLKGCKVQVSHALQGNDQAYEIGGTLYVSQKMYDAIKDSLANQRPRTTQEAMLAAIAASPLEDTPRLAYADWCDEFDKPQEACEQRLAVAMRRVVAEPDDDTPRLEYADVCERYGRKDRAEFIRLQCEIAKCEWDGDLIERRGLPLVTRESKLASFSMWQWLRQEWPGCPDETFAKWREYEPQPADLGYGVACRDTDRRAVFRRGFACLYQTDGVEWVRNGDAIAARQPVRGVQVTDNHPEQWFTFTGVDTTNGLPVYRVAGKLVRVEANAGPMQVLAARWPWITFVCA